MPDQAFPRLEYVVLDSHECKIAFSVFEASFGDGYGAGALVGSPDGLISGRLSYGHLARYPHRQTGRFSREAVADYIWDFFCARMREGNSPFIIRFARDKKDYLVAFTETELTYREFKQRFYQTGLAYQQRRVKGVSTLADGSLGVSENPDVI